jgi:hypothetical protein
MGKLSEIMGKVGQWVKLGFEWLKSRFKGV